MTGDIPSGLDNLTGLRQLALADNYLSGAIPSILGTRLTQLERLDLSNNGLTGEIPNQLTSVTGLAALDLSGNQLSGTIPADIQFLRELQELDLGDKPVHRSHNRRSCRQLDQLETLRLSENPLTGCIPRELRRTMDNDLSSLGLPYCDVLLSSLTVSGATLTPGFDPAVAEYTAVAGPAQVTVTPIGGAGVTFQHLDGEDRELVDADDMVDGHQVDLVAADSTIKVRVIAADGRATHTYVIQVRRAGIPGAPAVSAVTPGPASLHVAWTPPEDTGGTSIIAYDVRYIETAASSKSEDDWTVAAAVSTGGLTGVIGGLAADIEHDVQVRAFNGAHYSPWSSTTTGTPNVGACSTGRAVAAVAADPAANPGLVSDCEALLAVEYSLQGSGTLNWSVDTPMSQWQGVTLGGTPKRVTGLDRSEEGLAGQIPSSLDRLAGLQTLDLSDNGLTGSIPSRIGNLSGLETLDLSENALTGRIPPSLSGLAALETLGPGRQRVGGRDTGLAGQRDQPGEAGPQQEPVDRTGPVLVGWAYRPVGAAP